MRESVRKKFRVLVSIGASLLLLLFFIYLGFEDETVFRVTHSEISQMQYALVNEDKGATFEGESYLLGQDFVTLINKDMQNRWETTTRNIAKVGLQEGYFDAKLIIPQNFSEKLLSLKSVNPEKALIEYQVREGQNEITNQVIQNNVNAILKEFSERIIQMYFSSIVGNLSEAQQNVNQMTGAQINHQTYLERNIYDPFKVIPSSYESVFGLTSILDDNNSNFIVDQAAFVHSVVELLETNSQILAETSVMTEQLQVSIGEYTDESNQRLSKAIEQFTQQFNLHKQQLEEQWQIDTDIYKYQFNQFHSIVDEHLYMFYPQVVKSDSGVYPHFLAEAKLFQLTQINRISELNAVINDLENQLSALEELKKALALTYYNDTEATPESATEEQIKTAIIKLMRTEGASLPKLNATFFETIDQSLTRIPAESLEKLLEELVKQNLLTDQQASIFFDELMIARRYAEEFSQELESEVDFAYLNPEMTHPEKILIASKAVTFSIDTRQDTIISLQMVESHEGTLSFYLDEGQIQQMENELNQQLRSSGYQTSITNISKNSFTVAKPIYNEDDLKNNSRITMTTPTVSEVIVAADKSEQVAKFEEEQTTDKSSEPLESEEFPSEESVDIQKEIILIDQFMLPSRMSLTIDVPVTWTLSETQQETAFNQVYYHWNNGAVQQNVNSYAVYINMDQPLIDDLPEIMQQFQLLNTTVQQIVTILGNPEQSITVQSYADMLRLPENQEKSLIELAEEGSIYHRYGNITESEMEEMITDQLYDEYKNTGDQLYVRVDEQIQRLQATIGSENDQNSSTAPLTLYGILNLMTVPEKLLQEAEKLNNWFEEATSEIDAAYKSWSKTGQLTATSVVSIDNPHPRNNETQQIDDETSTLLRTMQEIMNASKAAIDMTEASAASVQDIQPLITELKDSTTEVQESMTTILTNLSHSVTESKTTIVENQEYAKNFEKVLVNTRIGGADNPQVFNFLANPIQGEGQFGRIQQISLAPYYATVICAILWMVISNVLHGFMQGRNPRETELLVEQTILWMNIPNFIIVTTTTIIMAGMFGIATTLSVEGGNQWAWFSYSFFVFASGLLLTIVGIRHFKKVTLYLYGIFLSMFFILTPLLGVKTMPGSFVNLLHRFSLLQNVQNGFTALLNGWKISWLTYLILFILVALGLILNLFVHPKANKGGEI